MMAKGEQAVESEQPDDLGSKEQGGEPQAKKVPREIGGPKGPEPTRFGDWERAGRCVDF